MDSLLSERLPGQFVLHFRQVVQRAGRNDVGSELHGLRVENLQNDAKGALSSRERAKDEIVCSGELRDADHAGPAQRRIRRKVRVLHQLQTGFALHDVELWNPDLSADRLGGSFRDPGEEGNPGEILQREHQQSGMFGPCHQRRKKGHERETRDQTGYEFPHTLCSELKVCRISYLYATLRLHL